MTSSQRHRDPTKRVRAGRAPYNFVPLADRVFTVNQNGSKNGTAVRYSGEILYELTVKTPLFVGDSPQAQEFLKRNGTYTVPASAIRGMLRSVVRAISMSGFKQFDDIYPVFRAFDGPDSGSYNNLLKKLDIHAGFLVQKAGKFYIQPAKRLKGYDFIRVSYDAVKNYFKPHDSKTPYGSSDSMWACVRPKTDRYGLVVDKVQDALPLKGKGKCKGGMIKVLLVRSGDTGNKRHHYAFLGVDDKATPIAVPQDYINSYLKDLGKTRERFTRDLISSDKGLGEPVFYYLKNGELYFFGPTLFSRLRGEFKVSDFIPEQVRQPEDMDLTDSIFGAPGSRGKVLVCDAPVVDDGTEPTGNQIRVGTLSSPSAGSWNYYLVQPKPDDIGTLKTWYGDMPGTIRGAKFYWHKPGISEPTNNETSRTAGFRKVTPMSVGTRFQGKLLFQDMTEMELGCLLSAMKLPNTKAHKLGMGKPFGLGSVGMDAQLRVIDENTMYADFGPVKYLNEEENKAIEERVIEIFRSEIVRFYNEGVDRENRVSGNSPLWDIPGIRSLGLLLEWTNAPALEKTSYMKFSGDDLERWKRKVVLPSPEGVASRAVVVTASTENIVASAEDVEVWEKALLVYEPGPRILRITHGQKKTEVVADRDLLMLSNLPGDARNRLIKKKKAIKIIARVAREGNKYTILEIWPAL